MNEMQYFIPGTTATVEAGRNGFVIHTEEGAVIAKDPNELLGVLLAELTNHAQVVAAVQAENAAKGESDSEETVIEDA